MLQGGILLALNWDYKIFDVRFEKTYFSAEEYFKLENPILSYRSLYRGSL